MPVSLNKLGGQRKLLLSDLLQNKHVAKGSNPAPDQTDESHFQCKESFTRNPSILCAITENNPCVSYVMSRIATYYTTTVQ